MLHFELKNTVAVAVADFLVDFSMPSWNTFALECGQLATILQPTVYASNTGALL
jgi:hypothetical protein